MACRWMWDKDIGRWFLPECWGGVNAGPDGCYCKDGEEPSDKEASLDERFAAIEERLARIEQAVTEKGT